MPLPAIIPVSMVLVMYNLYTLTSSGFFVSSYIQLFENHVRILGITQNTETFVAFFVLLYS